MPRISKSKAEMQYRDLRATLISEIDKNDMGVLEFARKCNIPYVTLHRRLNSPDCFTIGEIWTIANILNISPIKLFESKK